MQDTEVPTVPDVGQLTVTVRASGLIVSVGEAVAGAALASVAVTEIVLLPFVL